VVVTSTENTDSSERGLCKLLSLLRDGKHVLVLVVLYSAANLLSYYALARVDAAIYVVMAQVGIMHITGFLHSWYMMHCRC
jgi:hypothetical protein